MVFENRQKFVQDGGGPDLFFKMMWTLCLHIFLASLRNFFDGLWGVI